MYLIRDLEVLNRPRLCEGLMGVMWHSREASYTYLSLGEGNAQFCVTENRNRENHGISSLTLNI